MIEIGVDNVLNSSFHHDDDQMMNDLVCILRLISQVSKRSMRKKQRPFFSVFFSLLFEEKKTSIQINKFHLPYSCCVISNIQQQQIK